MRNLNFNNKGPFAKKENINQVIKDCFITKKFGVRKPQGQGVASAAPNTGHHGTKG